MSIASNYINVSTR